MKKITKIEQQKNNKNRYSIYIDDEFAFGVHEDVIVSLGISAGKEVDEDFVDKILKEAEQKKANNYALNLLSYSSRSKKEIIDKLTSKGFESDAIKKTIEFLKKYNYLDDNEYVRSYIKDRATAKGYGHQRIETELYRKGIEKEIIRNAINDLVDIDEEYNKGLELAQKKASTTYKNETKEGLYRKLGGFLQRKGYNYDTVMKILRVILKDFE